MNQESNTDERCGDCKWFEAATLVLDTLAGADGVCTNPLIGGWRAKGSGDECDIGEFDKASR